MKIIMKSWHIALTLTVAIMTVGCSDGVLNIPKKPEPSKTPLASPVISSFVADPTTVAAGGSTTLKWEASGADECGITALSPSGKFSFNFGPAPDNTGSTKVDSIPETTEFVLTCTKKAPVASGATGGGGTKPPPKKSTVTEAAGSGGGSADGGGAAAAKDASTTASVTVTVTSGEKINVDVSADATQVNPGDATVVRWTVTPADAKIDVSADSNEAFGIYAKCDGVIDAIETGEVADPAKIPAKACAVVRPEVTTTYTVCGTDAKGNKGCGMVTVNVGATAFTATIKVNGQSSASVASTNEPVVVSWEIQPSGAKVTITAEPAADCSPPLPQDQASDSGSTQCKITGDTAFSIKATKDGKEADGQAHVTVSQPHGAARLDINKQWGFIGETVQVHCQVPADVDPTIINQITIGTQSFATIGPDGISVPVVVMPGGVKVEMTYNGNQKWSDTAVEAVALDKKALADDEVGFTRVAFDGGGGSTLFGTQRKPFTVADEGLNDGKAKVTDGKIRIYKDGGAMNIDILGPLNAITAWQPHFLTDAIATYPVNAIAARPESSDQIFIGTTGLVLYSDGTAWKKVLSLPMFSANGNDYSGSHPSCAGQTQTGLKASFANQPVTLRQVCDLLVTGGGPHTGLVIATDIGVMAISDIDAFMANPAGRPGFSGVPAAGTDASAFPTFGQVANDLEAADGKIFAATSNGVFVSSDGGATFTAFGSAGNTLSLSSANGQLFAGMADGSIQASSTSSPAWAPKGSAGGAVLSLAVDPTSPAGSEVILVGTATGGKVTRDGGTTFAPIPGLADVMVRSVAIATVSERNGDGPATNVNYKVAIGSTAGAFSTPSTASLPVPAPAPPPPPPQGGTPGGAAH